MNNTSGCVPERQKEEKVSFYLGHLRKMQEVRVTVAKRWRSKRQNSSFQIFVNNSVVK